MERGIGDDIMMQFIVMLVTLSVMAVSCSSVGAMLTYSNVSFNPLDEI